MANEKLLTKLTSPQTLTPSLSQREREIESALICAVDFGGTNLRAANIDSNGKIHERVRRPTPHTNDANEIVSAIASAVTDCAGQAESRGANVAAVSVVVPGSVRAETGVVVNAPNVPSIVNFALTEALVRKLQRPIVIENDANAAALGEMWQGAARGCRTIVCLTLGTGVGSGIVLDGQLWRGVDGTAGEIGHTSIEPFGGIACKCGSFGCLEVYASATAIVRMAREEVPDHPESILRSIAGDYFTAKEIARAAEQGDALALEVFRQMGRHLGIACANIVNILNPEMIVIGGGVSAAFDLFESTAHAEMIKRAFPVPARRCQIVKAECGDDAGLLGAAWLAIRPPANSV